MVHRGTISPTGLAVAQTAADPPAPPAFVHLNVTMQYYPPADLGPAALPDATKCRGLVPISRRDPPRDGDVSAFEMGGEAVRRSL